MCVFSHALLTGLDVRSAVDVRFCLLLCNVCLGAGSISCDICTVTLLAQENVGLNLIHLLGDTETLAEHSGLGGQIPVSLKELCSRNNSSCR
jgi:hypothetical protein